MKKIIITIVFVILGIAVLWNSVLGFLDTQFEALLPPFSVIEKIQKHGYPVKNYEEISLTGDNETHFIACKLNCNKLSLLWLSACFNEIEDSHHYARSDFWQDSIPWWDINDNNIAKEYYYHTDVSVKQKDGSVISTQGQGEIYVVDTDGSKEIFWIVYAF